MVAAVAGRLQVLEARVEAAVVPAVAVDWQKPLRAVHGVSSGMPGYSLFMS